MTEGWRLFLCLAVCGLSPVLLQRLAARGGPIPLAGHILAVLFGLYAACLFLLLTARPIMAAVLSLSLMILLLAFNRTKERAIREPLVVADLYLLRQIITYPHLYFPFLPMKRIACGLALLVLALGALVFLEGPVARSANAAILLVAVMLPPLGIFLLRYGYCPPLEDLLLRLFPAGSDAAHDAARNGPLAVIVSHPAWAARWEREALDFLRDYRVRPAASRFPESMERMLEALESAPPENLPHIMLIQAESFRDIRSRVPESLKHALRDFLPHWDRLKTRGQAFDPPKRAYGAYTMRTEFAMLTGLRAEDLGPWAFNPYLAAAARPLWSLARHLAEKGYHTLCLHPFHKDFFSRDRVMPNLGFQRFVSIDELAGLEKFGPYVSDAALARRILQEKAAAEALGRPLFCFAITMEAHGPWLPGRLTEEEMTAVLPDIDAGACPPGLRMYLCHLRHMDEMFGMLSTCQLFAYGDHAPGGVG